MIAERAVALPGGVRVKGKEEGVALPKQSSTLQNGLGAYWKLNEAGGDRAAAYSDLTLTEEGTVYFDTGKQGLAAKYIAATANRLTAEANAAFSVSATGLWVAAWVNLTADANAAFVTKWGAAGAREWQLDYTASSKRFRFYANNVSDATVIAIANTFGTPSLNTWYLVCGWFDPADNKLRISVNGGAADASSALTGGMKAAGASGLYVGVAHLGTTSFTNGANALIDEVGLWNRPPTSDELTVLYNGGTGITYPFASSIGPTFGMPGAWTWFTDPRAVYYNGKTYFGVLGNDGKVGVRSYTHATPAQPSVFNMRTFSLDDHDNPALLVRDSDKRLIAFYGEHTGAEMYVRISTNAEDATAWGAEITLDATLGLSTYTYSNPVQLLGETNDPIYNIFRADDGSGLQYFYTKSEDGGATWSAAQKIWNQIRPYNRLVANGTTRLDFAVCTTHPDTAVNALYHCYYEGGSWYQSDGTLITASPPFDVSGGTKIYDAADNAGVRCWVWDIAIDSNGYPVIVYAVFPDTATNHRYRYARWTGAAWVDYEITGADGGYLYAAEAYYSAGVCLDHEDPDIVYLSKKVGGVYQIYKYTTADNGATWSASQITSRTQDCLRPSVVRSHSGSMQLMYFTGTYTSFTNYETFTVLQNG